MHLQLWNGRSSSRRRNRSSTVAGQERLLTSLRIRHGCNPQARAYPLLMESKADSKFLLYRACLPESGFTLFPDALEAFRRQTFRSEFSRAPRAAKTTPTPVIFRLHFPAILARKPSLLLHPLQRTRIKLNRYNRDRTDRIAIEWHFALAARSWTTARTSTASGQSRYRLSSSITPEFQVFRVAS